MTYRYGQPIVEPGRIAVMIENMTVAQIADRLGISEADVEGMLDQAGKRGGGSWELRCQKTGRWWRCHTERACYRKAQMLGLTDYDFGQAPAPAPQVKIETGDVNARIADFLGRGWSLARIGREVGMSGVAVHKRVKKMRGH